MIYHSLYSQDKMRDRNNEVLVASWIGVADSIEEDKKNKGALLASDFIHFIDNNLVPKLEYSLDVQGHVEEVLRGNSDLLYGSRLALDVYKPLSSEELIEKGSKVVMEKIELFFVQKLKMCEEVESIHSHKHLDTLIFTILLDSTEYDEDLMERFFETEYEIRDEFIDIPLRFNYLPILYEGDKARLVNPDYKLIFDKNAIGKPSFRPSSTQRTIGTGPETISFIQGLDAYNNLLRNPSLSGIQIGK